MSTLLSIPFCCPSDVVALRDVPSAPGGFCPAPTSARKYRETCGPSRPKCAWRTRLAQYARQGPSYRTRLLTRRAAFAARSSFAVCAYRIRAIGKRTCSNVISHSLNSVWQCSQRCGNNSLHGLSRLQGWQQRRIWHPSQHALQPCKPGMVLLRNSS